MQDPVCLVDPIYRAVGRNVFLFQQLESELRRFLAVADISGPPSELSSVRAAKARSLKKQTLGSLNQIYGRDVLQADGDEEPPRPVPEDLKEPHFHFRMRLQLPKEQLKKRKKQLSKLVKDRNRLVHHSLADWNPQSRESSEAYLASLDEQFRIVSAELDSLQRIISVLLETAKEALSSCEFRSELLRAASGD